jgi:hypothetical protein
MAAEIQVCISRQCDDLFGAFFEKNSSLRYLRRNGERSGSIASQAAAWCEMTGCYELRLCNLHGCIPKDLFKGWVKVTHF